MNKTDTRIQNLMFLLSAAPIAVGCVIVTDDTDTDAATEGPNTSGATEQATSADTEQATGVATEGMDGTATEGMDGTATEGVDGTATEGNTTGGDFAQVCLDYHDQIELCDGSEELADEGLAYCEDLLDEYYMYGADCQAAFESFLACLNALDCDQITEVDETPPDMDLPYCNDENLNIDVVCMFE